MIYITIIILIRIDSKKYKFFIQILEIQNLFLFGGNIVLPKLQRNVQT